MFFRTVYRIQQTIRTPSATARSIWHQSAIISIHSGFRTLTQAIYITRTPIDVYQPGNRLALVLSQSRLAEVKIVKAFTPFTNSVALLVDLLTSGHSTGLPTRFLLKLADRRVCPEWNLEREKEYHLGLQSHISKFGVSFELSKEETSPWMYFLDAWRELNFCHLREHEAYSRLIKAQASGLIPRFFGTAKITMMSTALHPSLGYINGLMLEYIPGRCMASIRPGITITFEEAEVISQRVLELGRRLRRWGVCHSDVHVGNIIIRDRDNSPVLIDWGSASFRVADFPLQERWNDGSIHTDFHKDIRFLLRDGVYYEGPNNEPVYPPMSASGVWHRFVTPLSDKEQIRLGREFNYRWVNTKIASLSKEEKDLFYDEDTSVDIDHGLRWKVKEGVKTRLCDDPVPVE